MKRTIDCILVALLMFPLKAYYNYTNSPILNGLETKTGKKDGKNSIILRVIVQNVFGCEPKPKYWYKEHNCNNYETYMERCDNGWQTWSDTIFDSW